MKLLSWNCRGLQQAAAVRALLEVQKWCKADIIFLSETHLEEWPAECLRKRLKMDRKEVSASNGQSGGLIMYWKNETSISLRFKTNNFIDVDVGINTGSAWRLTGMYGEPKWEDKYKTWQRMRDLHAQSDRAWLIIGDLN